MALKTVKAWAVVMKADDFLPDLSHPTIGSFYHICSEKKDADKFVKETNAKIGEKSWEVRPATITY